MELNKEGTQTLQLIQDTWISYLFLVRSKEKLHDVIKSATLLKIRFTRKTVALTNFNLIVKAQVSSFTTYLTFDKRFLGQNCSP